MDRETNQENQPLLPPVVHSVKEEGSRKQPVGANGGGFGSGDRLKRDEWSEGAVSCLLEAYESKWVLRNRAKLKGHDWEDVAQYVSSRSSCSKSPKTQTQCKNKIESMKKRYRSESAASDVSSWPLYPRLDLLLRGSGGSGAATTVVPSINHQQTPPPPPLPVTNMNNLPVMVVAEPCYIVPQQQPVVSLAPPPLPPPPAIVAPVTVVTAQNSYGSNGVEKGTIKEDGVGTNTKLLEHVSDDKNVDMGMETDSSTPALYSEKEKVLKGKKTKMKPENPKKKRARRRDQEWEIADSMRWLAEVVVRSEEARMETMRQVEKMRIEAEAKRGEMDLKRTEIIANTQLEIAKLFAGVAKPSDVDSSLRIGRS
ncbi:trihelix transcription factor ASIL2 [Mercurialis annua]|uniref:trihelix transcription factor ASIL2 n=1 Tax=Mercurialis annua TaxID=3986 RepID=UPI00215FD8ED|nr:trihelix transcription factor ASIL2 [Mercurialis annua]